MIYFQFRKYKIMKKISFSLLISVALSLVMSGCELKIKPEIQSVVPEINTSATSSLKVLNDEGLGIKVSYLAGNIPLVKEENGLTDDGSLAGKKRGIYFSDSNGGQENLFVAAFTSDYKFPPTAGCCFSYSGKPVDVSVSAEEINKTLRFPHLNNAKKIKIGEQDAIRFTGIGEDESGAWLTEYALMPFEKNGFSNLMFFGPRVYYVSYEDSGYANRMEEMKKGNIEINEDAKNEVKVFDELLTSVIFN